MKIDILTKEEYFKIKYPGAWEIKEYLKKQNEEKIKRLKEEIARLEGIVDLKYDKDGNPIFTGIYQRKYPIYQDTDGTVIYEEKEDYK